MESKEFRQRGREMVDYIAEYMESVGERRVTPAVEPGYLRDLIPKQAPQSGEGWDAIMSDVEDKIMPGVSPQFFFFPPHYSHYFLISLFNGHSWNVISLITFIRLSYH